MTSKRAARKAKLQFLPVRTRRFLPPRDDLYELLDRLPKLHNGDLLFLTSKVLAIHQGRCVKIDANTDKDKLIRHEADRTISRKKVPGQHAVLTIKNHTLIASAGIDESNANGYYVLWPKSVNKLLKEIWQYLRRRHKIKNLGVVATDSHLQPLRRGVTGISIGLYGFSPVTDYRGRPDIFGRKLKVTQANIVDSLAATAVLLMGEGNEQQPLLIVRGMASLEFTSRPSQQKLVFPLKQDVYYPLLKQFRQ